MGVFWVKLRTLNFRCMRDFTRVNQSESEQQLQIWKDLAISKQMIMNEAAAQLKLKPEWSQEELKIALDEAIQRAKNADVNMQRTRYEADKAISEMQEKVAAAEKAQGVAEATVSESEKLKQLAESQLANGRKDNADAIKKAKQQVTDKDRELKAINTALADTPDNVLKKLKNLKKQKLEEANARTKSEESGRKLKKDIKDLEETAEQQTELNNKGHSLADRYRELRTFAEKQQEALKAASLEAEDLPAIDFTLVDAFDQEDEAKEDVKKTAAHA